MASAQGSVDAIMVRAREPGGMMAVINLSREPGVLTPTQLRVFELREQHGCSWNQIAYMTDKAQATVRGHYRAAVRRIHHELERREGA